mgnify:CR=1 FL=1
MSDLQQVIGRHQYVSVSASTVVLCQIHCVVYCGGISICEGHRIRSAADHRALPVRQRECTDAVMCANLQHVFIHSSMSAYLQWMCGWCSVWMCSVWMCVWWCRVWMCVWCSVVARRAEGVRLDALLVRDVMSDLQQIIRCHQYVSVSALAVLCRIVCVILQIIGCQCECNIVSNLQHKEVVLMKNKSSDLLLYYLLFVTLLTAGCVQHRAVHAHPPTHTYNSCFKSPWCTSMSAGRVQRRAVHVCTQPCTPTEFLL